MSWPQHSSLSKKNAFMERFYVLPFSLFSAKVQNHLFLSFSSPNFIKILNRYFDELSEAYLQFHNKDFVNSIDYKGKLLLSE